MVSIHTLRQFLPTHRKYADVSLLLTLFFFFKNQLDFLNKSPKLMMLPHLSVSKLLRTAKWSHVYFFSLGLKVMWRHNDLISTFSLGLKWVIQYFGRYCSDRRLLDVWSVNRYMPNNCIPVHNQDNYWFEKIIYVYLF